MVRKDLLGSLELIFLFVRPLGTFEIYCQTSNHYQSGMKEHYSVSKCGKGAPAPDPRYEEVQTHYIMAQEVEWDYSPDRSWELEHHNSSGQER